MVNCQPQAISNSKTKQEKAFKSCTKGDSSLNNLASIDKANSEDFLKWKSLALSQYGCRINPFYVNIEGIALTDFYSRVIINPNGIVNLQEIMVEKKGEASKGTGERRLLPSRRRTRGSSSRKGIDPETSRSRK